MTDKSAQADQEIDRKEARMIGVMALGYLGLTSGCISYASDATSPVDYRTGVPFGECTNTRMSGSSHLPSQAGTRAPKGCRQRAIPVGLTTAQREWPQVQRERLPRLSAYLGARSSCKVPFETRLCRPAGTFRTHGTFQTSELYHRCIRCGAPDTGIALQGSSPCFVVGPHQASFLLHLAMRYGSHSKRHIKRAPEALAS